MSNLDNFIRNLFAYLSAKYDSDSNIIRKHTKRLNALGDLSFPLKATSWNKYINDKNACDIFDYATGTKKKIASMDDLISISKTWILQIESSKLLNDNYHIFLCKETTFFLTITEVMQTHKSYGSFKLNWPVSLVSDVDMNASLNLSFLRLTLLQTVGNRLLQFNNSFDENKQILLTLKSHLQNSSYIYCGAILNKCGSKNTDTTPQDFYRQRTEDMRLMAEHKYGLRITSKPGWKEFFEKLGSAAVTIEILQNKLSTAAVIDVSNHYVKNSSFILYNCARLCKLFKDFDKKVADNIYPALPVIEEIEFSLLSEPEEWELLYVYVLQFPNTIKSCIKYIMDCKLNIHYLLSSLAAMISVFSVYYRRIRILIEPKPHLFKILHARIYLLKSVEQVLHNSLFLLDIEPVKQM